MFGCRRALQYYGLQVKGLKKIDNYRKRQDEVKAYLAACEPEDVEYFVCQNELQERLVASYLEVDRIIGELFQSTRLSFVLSGFYPPFSCAFVNPDLVDPHLVHRSLFLSFSHAILHPPTPYIIRS